MTRRVVSAAVACCNHNLQWTHVGHNQLPEHNYLQVVPAVSSSLLRLVFRHWGGVHYVLLDIEMHSLQEQRCHDMKHHATPCNIMQYHETS